MAPPYSIAVLPFINISSDEGNDYFADGLAEELLNLLARLPQLRVAARTSSFAFRNSNLGIPEIDPGLVEAHAHLAWISMTFDWDFTAAQAHSDRALSLDPRNYTALAQAGALAFVLGRLEQSVALLNAGRYDEAEAMFQRALSISPDFISATGFTAAYRPCCVATSRRRWPVSIANLTPVDGARAAPWRTGA